MVINKPNPKASSKTIAFFQMQYSLIFYSTQKPNPIIINVLKISKNLVLTS